MPLRKKIGRLCLLTLVATCVDGTAPQPKLSQPTQLGVVTQPSAVMAGEAITPGVRIEVKDAAGNVVTSATTSVTVSITTGTGTPAAVLKGTLTRSAVNGVLDFSDLRMETAGTGYTLTATAAGLTGATSTPFTVTAAAAARLQISTQPVAAVAGAAIGPVQVAVQDAFGNAVSTATNAITLGITSGTGASGATLGGTATQTATGGLAMFSGLTITKAAPGYTLTATASELTSATTAAFEVIPAAASQLAITLQPSDVTAGASIGSPSTGGSGSASVRALQVAVQDAFGNTIPTATTSVTFAITSGSGTPGATLRGTTTQNAVSGSATFSDLAIDKAGAGYTLTATAPSLSPSTSTPFVVLPGVATKLAFVVQPSGATAGAAISPSVQVTVQDAAGNTVTTPTDVTIAIATGTGAPGAALSGTLTRGTVDGVATFTDLSIDKASASYSLIATAPDISSATGATFAVSAGAPTRLTITTQPTNAAASSAITPAIQVAVEDAFGNLITSSSASVAIAITTGTGPAGAALGGNTTQSAVGGIATFADLSIDKASAGYTLTATSGSLASAVTNVFAVSSGLATKLVFVGQPSDVTAGSAITPGVRVAVQDAAGNAVLAPTSVTLTITSETGAASGALRGNVTQSSVDGIATFNDLVIDKAVAGYTLTATSTGLTSATSSAFTVSVGAAAQLAFAVQPVAVAALTTITPAIQVVVEDAAGNTVLTPTSVTLAITSGSGTPGAVLGGTRTRVSANGVAVFDDLSIDKVGANYTLTAISGALPSSVSASFAVTPGAATQLSVVTQPSTVVAGQPITPGIQIAVRDAGGNVVTSATTSITVAITSGTGTNGAVLGGTTTRAAENGVATFAGLSIDKASAGYAITASSEPLTSAITNTFTVAVGEATGLAFVAQPSDVIAGLPISPAVQVVVRDAAGNTVTTATSVTLAITPGTGATGAVLASTLTQATVNGIATFTDLVIQKAGTGYTLTATADGIANAATSAAFAVSPAPATRLAITTQPADATAGVPIAPPVQVVVQDQFGNLVTSSTATITLAITSGTGANGAVLGGTTTRAAENGVATFAGLSIDKASAGYTLTATALDFTSAVTNTFTVSAGEATELAFVVQPSDVVAGEAIRPSAQIVVQDAAGNTVTTPTNVTLAITPGTGATGAVLAGTFTQATVNGIATFTDLVIQKAGTGYTLTATADGIANAATSAAFAVSPAPATRLAITTQPANATAGVPIAPPVQVTVHDEFGNTVPTSSTNISIAISTGTGAPDGTLSGSLTQSTTAGVATFADLSIDKASVGYALVATATGLTPATSQAFTINAAMPSRLAILAQPASGTAGVVLSPALQVAVQDNFGNVVTGASPSITLAITAGTGAGGAILSGTTTRAAVNGIATFDDLSIDKASGGYRLTTTSPGLTGATSSAFTIRAAAPSRLAIATQPASVTAGGAITPAVQVAVHDSFGNVVTSASPSITLAITAGTGAGGAILSGTTTRAPENGVATFAGLSIDKASAGYTLTATAPDLTSAVTNAFTVAAGEATKLAFVVQPSHVVAGEAINPSVQIVVQDAAGNTVTTPTSVTLAITPGTGATGAVLAGTLTQATVTGTATFTDLSIDKASAGYTLTATATALTPATSSLFTVGAAAPSHLAIVTQPTTTTAGAAIAPAIQVAVRDALGNVVAAPTSSVSLAITMGSGIAGASLSGITTRTTVNGIATFPDLSIDKASTNYTLTATSTGLASGITNSFTVSPAVAAKLAFVIQPTDVTAGVAITPSVQVVVQDVQGNTVTTPTNVAIAIASGTGAVGATLIGTLTQATVNGIATFNDLSIAKASAGYSLTATATGLSDATSSAFKVDAAAASRLAIVMQPTSMTAGVPIMPAVQVAVQDAFDNTVTTSSASISVAIASGTGAVGATLSGTTTRSAIDGVVAFNDLSIDKAGTGYALTLTSPDLASATSGAFMVNAATAAQLTIVTQPSNAAAGVAIAPAVQVAVQDVFGNSVSTPSVNVTVAITSGTGAPGATLVGTLTQAAVDGIAAFPDLSIEKAAAGYTLSATSSGLTAATSSAFAVTSGAPTKLALVGQPSSVTAGVAISPSVQVVVQDAAGNTVTTPTDVTIAITTGSGAAGAVLSGTLMQRTVNGVATFGDLSITKTGTGYTLTATATDLTGATSTVFNVNAAGAATLAITTQPTTTTAGVAIAPAVQATVQDAFGNTVTTSSANVSVAITSGTGAPDATLAGSLIRAAIGGVATFADLSINKASTGYTLMATAAGLGSATSNAFAVRPAAAATLAFAAQPSDVTAGVAISPNVQVVVQDALGNPVTAPTSVTLAITPGTGATDAIISGSLTQVTVNGIATFSDLSIATAGTGYTLTATATDLASATSGAFTVNAAAAARLTIVTQPSDATAGVAIVPAVQVAVHDAFGNTVTASNATIAVAITSGSGDAGATLSGTTSRSAVNGVVGFDDLSIAKAGTGYTLTLTSVGLTSAISTAFDVTAATATRLGIVAQPTNTSAGTAITPVRVVVHDAFGNVITNATTNVSLAITTGSGAAGATLSGTTTRATINGVATFADLSIDKAGAGYTLTTTSAGLTDAITNEFVVSVGAATQLAFTVPPSDVTAGSAISPSVQVALHDAFGNLVAGATANVTVAITNGTGAPGATLGGAHAQAALNGVATFSDLSIDKASSGYSLTATATGLTSAASTAFAVSPAAASRLAIKTQPANTTTGTILAPALEVAVEDAFANPVTTSSANISIAITSGTGAAGATLAGTTTRSVINGIATFADLSIDKASADYTLTATAGGLTSASTNAFAVSPGTATTLAFAVHPSDVTAGVALTPSVQIVVQDAAGNTVTTPANVTLALTPGNGTAGAVLNGSLTQVTVNGIATFSDLSIATAGTGYTLTATATDLASATSGAFTVNAAAAARLTIVTQPSDATAGVAIVPAVQVAVQDVFGNAVSTASVHVTIAITSGTGAPGATLAGTLTQAAINGVAMFPDLSIEKAAAGYTLTAAASGLASTTSVIFAVNPAAATQLAITTQPTTTTAGAPITPAVQVAVQDAFGNVVTAATSSVSLALTEGSGAAGATVSGTTTQTTVNGTATFADLSIDKASTGYTLTATSAGLTSAITTVFVVSPGAAATLAFAVQPSDVTAGVAISPSVQVVVRDASGNTVSTATVVTIAITTETGAAGAVLTGTLTQATVNGIATFSDVSIDKASAGYTLTATATDLTNTVSTAFTVNAAAATQLVVATQPASATAGVSITPAVQIHVQDAFENLVTTSSASISLAITGGTGASGATLSGTTTLAALNGIATFGDLSIDKASGGYTLTATSAELATATSNAFDVSAAAATRLAIAIQPTNTMAGVVMTPGVRVIVEDAFGNLVSESSASIELAITSGVILGGTSTRSAVNGVATFNDLTIEEASASLTLTATSTGLTSATSSAFAVSPSSAAKLAFLVQPSNVTAGVAMTPSAQVVVRDAFNNTVTDAAIPVTLAITGGAGGATLTGTATRTAANGVATFDDLSIDKASTGYSLTATSSDLASATSSDFVVAAATPAKVAFAIQPIAAVSGAPMTPIQVSVLDVFGNVVLTSSASVSLAISSGTGAPGATLGGTSTRNAGNGLATFADLTIDIADAGYTLTATSAGLTSATSSPFAVSTSGVVDGPSPAPDGNDRMIFDTRPGGAQDLNQYATKAQILPVWDQGENGEWDLSTDWNGTGANAIRIEYSSWNGVCADAGSTLVRGIPSPKPKEAYFQFKLWLGRTPTGGGPGNIGAFQVANPNCGEFGNAGAKRLLWYRDGVDGASTGRFEAIWPGALSVSEGVAAVVGSDHFDLTYAFSPFWNPQSHVGEVQTHTYYFKAASSPSAADGIVRAWVNGVQYIDVTNVPAGDWGIDRFEFPTVFNSPIQDQTEYWWDILVWEPVGPVVATKLAFVGQPSGVTAAAAISPSVKVTVRDAVGNTVLTPTTVTLAITSGTGATAAVLGGTVTQTSVNGIATFADLTIDKAAAGYTLTATSSGLTSAISAPFAVTAGAAAKLAFVAQPTTGSQGTAVVPAITVAVRDAADNTVTTSTASITVAITPGTGTSGATLSGTLTVPAVDGVATFGDLAIDRPGSAYTLTATAAGLTSDVSSAFAINGGTITGTVSISAQTFAAMSGSGSGSAAVTSAKTSLTDAPQIQTAMPVERRRAEPMTAFASVATPSAPQPAFAPDELIVTFKSVGDVRPPSVRAMTRASLGRVNGALRRRATNLANAHGAAVIGAAPAIRAVRIRVPDPSQIEAIRTALERNPDVESVQRNAMVSTSFETTSRTSTPLVPMQTPSDPDYARQAWNYLAIDLDYAWGITTGSNSVIVAVIDDGIRLDHPDLAANLTNDGYDFVPSTVVPQCGGGTVDLSGDGDGPDNDPTMTSRYFFNPQSNCYQPFMANGAHGLHVAGTIGASANNGLGGVGVNWSVRIRPVRVLNVTGNGTTFDIAQGILYAAGLPVDIGGGTLIQAASPARIINLSLGSPTNSTDLHNAVIAAAANNVLIVASAGNSGNATEMYPASYPEVVSVSAVGPDLNLASYSTFGSTVDIAAPGGDISDGGASFGVYSTRWSFATNSPTYESLHGTSMAAPHVAGVAALILALNPSLSAVDVRARLENFAVDLGAPGRDDLYGVGLLNARNSLTATMSLTQSTRARLYNAMTGAFVADATLAANGTYAFTQVATGSYWVFAGQDEDSDELFGLPRRRWSAFGGTARPTIVPVTGAATQSASFDLGFAFEQEDNNSTTTADLLVLGGHLRGSASAADADFAAIALPAGGQYTFETQPHRGACGFAEELDTVLELYNSTGDLVATNDDVDTGALNRCSRISMTLSAGTYYVRTTGRDATARRYNVVARAGP